MYIFMQNVHCRKLHRAVFSFHNGEPARGLPSFYLIRKDLVTLKRKSIFLIKIKIICALAQEVDIASQLCSARQSVQAHFVLMAGKFTFCAAEKEKEGRNSMGTGKRFQRILSFILSLAMAVTLLPAQMAYAEGTNAPGNEANATSPGDGMGLPKELAHFSFDSEEEIAGKVVGDAAKAKIVSGDNGRDSSPFLQLSGAAIRALDGSILAGKKELTISYWSKSEGDSGWAFYAAKDNLAVPTDNYIGILDKAASVAIERYLDGRPAGSSGNAGSLASAWRHVTVVFGEESTEVYVNSERKIHLTTGQAPLSQILTDKTVLKIGAANWGRGAIESNDADKPGEIFKGGIDDFAVYDGALDAAQVKYLYDGTKNDQGTETSLSGLELKRNTCKMSAGGSMDVTSLLKVPAGAGSRVTVESSDSSTVAVAGKTLRALKAGNATLTIKWRYGAKTYTIGTVTVTVTEFQPVKTYGFEDALDDAAAIKTKLADYDGQVAYAENGHHGKALQLKEPTFKTENNKTVVDNAGYGVKLKEGKLGADYTVSLWVNPEKGFYQQTPILSLGVGNDEAQNWISVSGTWKEHPGSGTAARVWSVPKKGDAAVEFNGKYTNTAFDAPNGKWTMLTVSQCGNDLKFYVNGKENGGTKAAQEVLNQEGALICIGINNWDPSFGGMVDDVSVYDSALDAAQVQALYRSSLSAGQAADWLEIKGENDSLNCVTEDLNLPTQKDGVGITWTAKEGQQTSTAVTAQGKVTAGGGNAVTLTASCSDAQTGLSWTTEIPIKVARRITVKCLDEDKSAGDNEADLIQAEELLKEEGSEYVHAPEEIIITDAGDAYKYDAEGTKNTAGLKVTVGAGAEVHVAYKAVEIKGVVTPDDAYVIEGNDPILPKTLKATIDAGNGATAEANAPVKWTDSYEGLKARKEPYVIKGTVGNINVSAKVTVFECDAKMPEVEATYTNNATTRFLSLNGSYKGVIETEFDLVNVSKSTQQGAFFLLEKDAPGAWWNNSAALEFDADGKDAKGYYRAIGGNGKGGSFSASGGTYYPANKDAANAIPYDGTGTYHVRIRIDTTDIDSTVEKIPAQGDQEETDAPTVKKNATFRIWMTDANGKTTELTMGDAATSRYIKSGIISQYFVGTYIAAENGDFKVTNHKLSWQSGYVAKNIETYIDDVKAADLSSSGKLLPYGLMTEEEQAAYAYKPEPNIMQDGEKCVLQTKESGWFDKDGNKVADDKVAEKAVAGASLTYKAYYKKGVADFAGLGEKIEKAQGQYDEMAAIYTAASLKYLDDAIKAAQAVAATEGTANEAAVDAVETAIADLQVAMDRKDVTLVPKDYAAMNEMLAAYYPMNEESQAKDAAGENDGTVHGDISFTDDGGAAFPGGSSLANYISLPNTLKITDKMTFSFWAYCDNSADTETTAQHKMHNTFCIGSGKKIGNNQGTKDAHHFSIYAGQDGANLTVNGGANGWSGVQGVTVENYEKQKWSLVTVVVDGKKAAIYQDGVEKDSGEIGITLTEAWNASPDERYILLGNNCYAYNGDWDYKGNIKNLRVYNVPLAGAQVKDIFDHEVQEMLASSAGRLADTIKAQPGTGADEGKYTLTITQDTIKLPKAGAQKEAISWKSYAADGVTESNAVINAETGAVTVPEPGAAGVTAVLKATITISGVEKEVWVICDVKNPINKESTAALKDEAKAAMEGKDKADYDEAVWNELLAAIQACEDLTENAAPQEIAAAYNRLKAALEAFVPKTVIAVTGVTLNQASLTLEEGQDAVLSATVSPQGADQTVVWASSNPAAATVVDGRVVAVKAGTAVITATSVADQTKKASCTVTVTAKAQALPAAVQNVKLNVKKMTMGVKESYTLKATVNPANASNKKVTWKSDKPKVVSVKNGKLKALKTGKAKITATSAADKNKKATITVTVKKAPDKKAKVTLNKKSVKLKVKKTFQIKAKVSSKYGSATFKYTIDKKGKKAVKVDKNGKVTAKKKGKATITVKPYNGKGKSVKIKITVK